MRGMKPDEWEGLDTYESEAGGTGTATMLGIRAVRTRMMARISGRGMVDGEGLRGRFLG